MNRQRKIIDRFYNNFKADFYSEVPALHQSELSAFQLKEFGAQAIQAQPSFNQWMYSDNLNNKRIYCYSETQIAGQQSSIEGELAIKGESVDSVCAINLMVAEEWKMKGIGVALMGSLLNNHDVVVCLGVSDDAYKMFIRQGWSDMGKTSYFIKPMKLQALFKDKKESGLMQNVKLLAASLLSKLVDMRYQLKADALKFEKIHSGDQLDDLMILDKSGSSSVYFRRSLKYLKWRYFDFPGEQPYELYRVKAANNRFPGYFASKVAKWNNKKALIISDVESQPENFNQYVDAIVRLAKSKNVDVILYQGVNLALEKTLASRQFYERPHGDIFVYYCNNDKYSEILKNKENWAIKFSDSDMDFCYF